MTTIVNNITFEDILALVPQQKPFRYIDKISELDGEHICGHYRFRKDEFFYSGHFPGRPVTPGVILLESMCQVGVVAFGIYLLSLAVERDEIKNWLTMFTEAQVEFVKAVYPGDLVTISAKKMFWRRMKLKAIIEMHDSDGVLVASAVAAGIGVRR